MSARALVRLVAGALTAAGAVTLTVQLAGSGAPPDVPSAVGAPSVPRSVAASIASGTAAGVAPVTTFGAREALERSLLDTAPPEDPHATAAGARRAVGPVQRVLPGGDDLGPVHVDPLPPDVRPGAPVDLEALYARAGLDPDVEVAAGTVPPGTPSTKGLTAHVEPSCSGTGTDGNRVQVLYVRETGTPSDYAKALPLLRNEVANVDDVFAVSAQQTGGVRRVRWVHAACVPVIPEVVLPAGSLGSFSQTISALKAAGYNRPDRKYLAFADAQALCGVGTYYVDARTTDNYNDGKYASYARVDRQCWSSAYHSTAAHELVHNLGGVLPSSPNATDAGHCTDESDLMCYDDDGTGGFSMRSVCGSAQEQLLDCRKDDYFHTAPPAGSHLATTWNTASSGFLDSAVTAPPLAISIQPSTTAAETGDLVSVTTASPGATSYAWTLSAACTLSGTTTPTLSFQCPSTVTGPVTVSVRVADSTGRTADVATVVQMTRASAPAVDVTAPTQSGEGGSFTLSAAATGKPAFGYLWSSDGPCTLSSSTAQAPVATCPEGTAGALNVFELVVTQADGQQTAVTDVSVGISPVAWSAPSVSQSPIQVMATLTDAGTGLALRGMRVTLQSRRATDMTWADVGPVVTDTNGLARAPVQRRGARWYRFVVGDPPPPEGPAASTAVLVKGSSEVTAAWSGARRAVTGRVVDGDGLPVPDARVVLQRKVGTGPWRSLTTVTSTDDGRVSLGKRPRRATYFRWVFRGSTLLLADRSRSVRAG